MSEDTTALETFGCDLGDRRTAIFVLDKDGRESRVKVPTTPKALTAYFSRPRAHVIVEVGTHSRWVSELLEGLGHLVTVANPRKVQLISQSNDKSDDNDGETLARLGRVDRKLLSPVRHRGRQAQTELAVAKTRDLLVRQRTKLVNHVRGVLKSFGLRLPKCDTDYFARRTRDLIPAELKMALDPLYETLQSVDEQIKQLDKTIERIAKRHEDVAVLAQPNGVGTLTALVYLLTVEDKHRLTSSRMAGALLGLRPRRAQSGDNDPQLGITKSGDPFLRRLLVQSAHYILGPFGKDSDLRRWGLALCQRGGKNAKKRAAVAVARKLATLMHRLWVTGELYEPIGYRRRRPDTETAVA